ncbi:hypothetical protein R3P38DRAFT_2888224 [Favolaschia claudopus]|uniref:GATA-type domain-containing protein n=1 Tax=Favolaschia claudopus TaxID=2862362 RepID=A0AAW0CUZ3_9AGAR
MSFHGFPYNPNSHGSADQQQRGRHSRSNSGQQWVQQSDYMSSATAWNQGAMNQPMMNAGGYYSGPSYPEAEYPATPYTHSSSTFAQRYPPQPGYQSGYIDSRYNQASSNPQHTNWHHGMSSVDPSYPAPSTTWPQTYNYSQPHNPSSFHGMNTPTPPAGGASSSRNNQGRQYSPATAQIHLPESEPGDYRGSGNSTDGTKECSHCRATSTPLWRRDPRTHKTLCNACGLYLHQHGALRPANLIAVDNMNPVLGGDFDAEHDGSGPECANCGTRKTSTWRRGKGGEQVCNACGVYERMNGRARPLALRNDKIRPRSKH